MQRIDGEDRLEDRLRIGNEQRRRSEERERRALTQQSQRSAPRRMRMRRAVCRAVTLGQAETAAGI